MIQIRVWQYNGSVCLILNCVSLSRKILGCICSFSRQRKSLQHRGTSVYFTNCFVWIKKRQLHVDSFQNMNSCILNEGEMFSNLTLRQWVEQGRILSSWFFLSLIDGIILELDCLKSGPNICDLHFSYVILAVDTSLISNTQTTLQTQVNVS